MVFCYWDSENGENDFPVLRKDVPRKCFLEVAPPFYACRYLCMWFYEKLSFLPLKEAHGL